MKPKAICLDLDGTLFDTVPEMHEAANFVLQANNIAPVALADARSYVGDGLLRFTKRIISKEFWAEPRPQQVYMVFAQLQTAYAEIFLRRNSLYPQVAATLTQLSADWQLAVVTNKPQRFTHELLATYLGEIDFKAILCGDSKYPRKPDPAGLLAILASLGVEPQRALMVGDTIADARVSLAAELKAYVHVNYGYHQGDKIKADFAIDSFAELLPICTKLALT